MLLDLSTVEPGHFDERGFDVCICGAGVAGIILARKLPQKLKIALLEGGGLEMSHESQSVYRGNNTGQEYFPLDATRLRYFGGTSNHWAGWCSPLEARDFEASPYVERLGWPIRRGALEPYLQEASDILDADFGGVENSVRWVKKVDDFRDAVFAFSKPLTRLGEKYRKDIERSSNIWCYLNANLTDIVLVDKMSSVRDVEVRDYGDGVHRLKARVFVLATGGMENPRILLYCNSQLRQGIGNDRGLVGKFFGEHPKAEIGKLLLEDHAN
ncbi:MAG: GMC family oxidoreductase, partial [Proteobacteria bacterium]|nr:GMC family oxidoreductase [Pseudomonadota bacterium]